MAKNQRPAARETPSAVIGTIHALADAGGDAIAPFFRQGGAARNKLAESASAGFDPVTEADTACERAMRAVLAAQRPEDGIVGEEYRSTAGSSGWTWVLDPIDGTRAFVAGAVTWGVLVGAVRDGVVQAGGIIQPYVGERWVASSAGDCVWQRGHDRAVVHASAAMDLDHAVIATTDPNLFNVGEQACFNRLRDRARITRYGLDCMAYAFLASGGIGLVIENRLQPYDVAALIPVVQAAGGMITDWRGAEIRPLDGQWSGQVIAAANPALHAAALTAMGPVAAAAAG